jgi:hypothetical protein
LSEVARRYEFACNETLGEECHRTVLLRCRQRWVPVRWCLRYGRLRTSRPRYRSEFPPDKSSSEAARIVPVPLLCSERQAYQGQATFLPTREAVKQRNKVVRHVPCILLSGAISADPSDVTPLWPNDLSGRSLDEVLRAKTENRAWHRTLRQRATALVNSRLAKAISLEEYAAGRQQANEDAAECKRREGILDHEIHSRGC